MYRISQTIGQFRKVKQDLSLHLVEVSPKLSQIQQETICGSNTRPTQAVRELDAKPAGCYKALITNDGIPIFWYNSLEDVPNNGNNI